MGLLNRWMLNVHRRAAEMNNRNILRLLEPCPSGRFVDLGCFDGEWTTRVASVLRVAEVYGVDLDEEAARLAFRKGIQFLSADLNRSIPLADESMDVVHSNQVIEHLTDVDTFTEEICRILRPGGYAIISTENLASVDNLLALALGQQAFSQHVSKRFHIGNRFSPHFGEPVVNQLAVHRTIFSYFGLAQFIRSHNLNVDAELGAGYPLFPRALGRLDSVHARFITVKARKPLTQEKGA